MTLNEQIKILDNKIRPNQAQFDLDRQNANGHLARNGVGLFQIFNHVKTIKKPLKLPFHKNTIF